MIPLVFYKLAMDDAEKRRVDREFARRLNKKHTDVGYSALPKDYDAYAQLQHVPGIPFLKHPVREIHEAQGMKGGDVYAPTKDDAYDLLQGGMLSSLFKDKHQGQWTAAQRGILTSMVKAHELDEVHTTPRRSMASHGHNSPEVILREHNRVVDLPDDMQPVKDLFREMRTTDPWRFLSLRKALKGKREDRLIQKVDPDFVYGEGKKIDEERMQEITDRLERRAERMDRLASAGWLAGLAGALGYALYKGKKGP